MFDIADKDDAKVIVTGAIYVVLLLIGLCALAAALGLAWTVFRLVGGL